VSLFISSPGRAGIGPSGSSAREAGWLHGVRWREPVASGA
jgi:hypothetical protein